MTWVIEFNDKNPDQTKRRSWTIPDDMDAGLREISELRTTSSVAVSAMWKPDSEPPLRGSGARPLPPRFIVSIDFPKDVVLVCQTPDGPEVHQAPGLSHVVGLPDVHGAPQQHQVHGAWHA